MLARQEVLPLPVTPQVSCVFVVRYINGKEHVLVARRLQGPEKGKRTLPGGNVKIGESPSEAAWRELKEETGLSCDRRYLDDYLISAEQAPLTITVENKPTLLSNGN